VSFVPVWVSRRTPPGREPALDRLTELWWAAFRWPESEREAARRDVNQQQREREARNG
jgi:hypothetical protein